MSRELMKQALKALELSEQEPVAWVLNFQLFWPSEYEVISTVDDKAIPLYTAPPQRQWVGLTDDEIMEPWPAENRIAFARWVEAKLKEKNHG